MNTFEDMVRGITGDGLQSDEIDIVQVNVGFRCNQQCTHCHLDCSPQRRESMQWATMELVLHALQSLRSPLVDLTGGAPELNPHVPRFIAALRKARHRVQLRTNLTVLLEPGMETMPEFLKQHQVQLVASMPCYLERNVRAQRGPSVYEKSIEAIRRLNGLGYGCRPGLALDLVYNPVGPFLPPSQDALEADYREDLGKRFGIKFSRLLTITNMPIGRFGDILRKGNRYVDYMQLLRESFNPRTIDDLMCRHQITVDWMGTIYDCDFNLALGMPVDHGAPDNVLEFEPSALLARRIVTGEHCFGCTAGFGSSCRGALV
ncbi:MAG: arsenosugar biosynthesis radical SAM protein ArsS [Planctomycetia bacterium]|nr:arsenosugar biosynthesis radical SAM protein ArsS [Planctomycetia bacterium]